MRSIIDKGLSVNPAILRSEFIAENQLYDKKYYQYIYRCTVSIYGEEMNILICIPQLWGKDLIDVYVENFVGIQYIPHLEDKGKLCLFDLEGILIDIDLAGILNATIERAIKILNEGILGDNSIDFINEFESYWGKLDGCLNLKSKVILDRSVKEIKYADNKIRRNIRKNETQQQFMREGKQFDTYACDNLDTSALDNFYNNGKKKLNEKRNGIYISINATDNIYPPDWREKIQVEYINRLLQQPSIDVLKVKEVLCKCSNKVLVLFGIWQPNDILNTLGILIDKKDLKCGDVLKISDSSTIIPMNVVRWDTEYLGERGGAFKKMREKKVLIVGCGSIGGYLVNELSKTGISNITIIDPDRFHEENIYRHILGMQYVNSAKVEAMREYISKNIPDIKVEGIVSNIQDAIEDESVDLNKYDIIVSTTGNHNVNRWINTYVHAYKINAQIVYLWNEILGIGSHVAFINTQYHGCYECFIGDDDTGIYDKTSYCKRGQNFTKRVSGCGSSYIPFSSTHSVQTVIIGIKVIKEFFDNRISDNLLISLKGDSYYYSKLGYEVSDRYTNQEVEQFVLKGIKFKKEKCKCCEGI